MRRVVALLALTAMSWSHLVAFRCDMGAATDPAAHHESESARAHHETAAHNEATARHAAGPAGSSAKHEGHSGPAHGSHGDATGCVMALACASASARAAQSANMTRLPALFVLPDFRTAPIPLAAALAVETPPPRRTV